MDGIETGSVVLLKFPFSDGIGYKRRPAMVIKDFEDGDILVCRITSRTETLPRFRPQNPRFRT
jgi:mRNA interferase MazF